jgi:hypothetical protein
VLGDAWYRLPPAAAAPTPALDLEALVAGARSEVDGGRERLSGRFDPGALAPALPRDLARAVREDAEAEGSLTVDADSHLPTDLALLVHARGLPDTAGGIRGFTLDLEARFDGWDEPFTVERPAGARPLDADALRGLGPLSVLGVGPP